MAASLTCNRPTLASNRRGFAHKIAPNGVQLRRRLCSPLGVPPDDDDDDSKVWVYNYARFWSQKPKYRYLWTNVTAAAHMHCLHYVKLSNLSFVIQTVAVTVSYSFTVGSSGTFNSSVIQDQKSTWHWKFSVDGIEQICEATSVTLLCLIRPNWRSVLGPAIVKQTDQQTNQLCILRLQARLSHTRVSVKRTIWHRLTYTFLSALKACIRYFSEANVC